jgi:hypothetical protein
MAEESLKSREARLREWNDWHAAKQWAERAAKGQMFPSTEPGGRGATSPLGVRPCKRSGPSDDR